MATIYAWSGALMKRGQLDNLPELVAFGERLESASIATIEAGTITGDLAALLPKDKAHVVTTENFLKAIAARL